MQPPEVMEVSLATTKGHRLRRRRRLALPTSGPLRLARSWRLTPSTILYLNPDCEEAEAPVRLNLLVLSPCPYSIPLTPTIRSSTLRLILAACVLMHDSNGDAISRQRYKHTTAPVTGFIILYGDSRGTEGQKHYLKLLRTSPRKLCEPFI
jgi:hypothetical protein